MKLTMQKSKDGKDLGLGFQCRPSTLIIKWKYDCKLEQATCLLTFHNIDYNKNTPAKPVMQWQSTNNMMVDLKLSLNDFLK